MDGEQDPIAMSQGKKKDALPTGKRYVSDIYMLNFTFLFSSLIKFSRRKLKLPKLPRLEDDKPDDGEYPYQDDDPQRYKEIMNQISLKRMSILSKKRRSQQTFFSFFTYTHR